MPQGIPRNPSSKLKILILNWRDIKNPISGGAEVLTHQMARRWVRWGHEVTQFSSLFENAKKEEVIDGVKLIRRGKEDARYLFSSVHFKAFLYYQKYFKNKFDVVIDEIHGLPFFTPLYVKEKKIALICEVADKIWDINFPYPLNVVGKLIEKNYFRIYKKIPFVAISSSTKKDLLKFGIDERNTSVLSMGIDVPKPLWEYQKEKSPTIIFVGRLMRAKGIEDAIKLCQILVKDFPTIKLWVVGKGNINYENKIKQQIDRLGLKKNIILWGFINEKKKFELMQKAHILISPSLKEGFGLTIPEAGIVGTPAVVYNVEGLRDAVRDGENGILVEHHPQAMANGVKKLFLEKELYAELRQHAINYAKRMDWDNTAKEGLEIINKLF